MAFDFPNSPTVGQEFEHYAWDGEKWNIVGSIVPPPPPDEEAGEPVGPWLWLLKG